MKKSPAPALRRDQVADSPADLRAINEAAHHIAPDTATPADADRQWTAEEREIAELKREK